MHVRGFRAGMFIFDRPTGRLGDSNPVGQDNYCKMLLMLFIDLIYLT